ncbi:MAG: zinc ribbon domain-containing protein [Lachnospiraceae bacterium]|nr:zinc ribbon domain-containing protein [Lachnospiraceae bacterium]
MKICPKCNHQVPDDAAFCNECGTKMDTAAAATPAPVIPENNAPAETPQPAANNAGAAFNAAPAADAYSAPQNDSIPAGASTAPDAAVSKKPKKTMIIGIAAVAAVVVIALILILVLAGGSYKKPIRNLVGLANKRSQNVTDYLDCVTPAFVGSSYKSFLGCLKGGDAKKELDKGLGDIFEDTFDDFEDDYGKNWKISIEWRDADKLSSKKLKDIQENWEELADALADLDLDDEDTWESLADLLDDEYETTLDTKQFAKLAGKLVDQIENAKITAGYEVEIKLTIQGKDDKDTAKLTLNVIKVNGKWIIDPISFAGEEGYSTSYLIHMLKYM